MEFQHCSRPFPFPRASRSLPVVEDCRVARSGKEPRNTAGRRRIKLMALSIVVVTQDDPFIRTFFSLLFHSYRTPLPRCGIPSEFELTFVQKDECSKAHPVMQYLFERKKGEENDSYLSNATGNALHFYFRSNNPPVEDNNTFLRMIRICKSTWNKTSIVRGYRKRFKQKSVKRRPAWPCHLQIQPRAFGSHEKHCPCQYHLPT